MSEKTKVAVVLASEYEQSQIDVAVENLINQIGGMENVHLASQRFASFVDKLLQQM